MQAEFFRTGGSSGSARPIGVLAAGRRSGPGRVLAGGRAGPLISVGVEGAGTAPAPGRRAVRPGPVVPRSRELEP